MTTTLLPENYPNPSEVPVQKVVETLDALARGENPDLADYVFEGQFEFGREYSPTTIAMRFASDNRLTTKADIESQQVGDDEDARTALLSATKASIIPSGETVIYDESRLDSALSEIILAKLNKFLVKRGINLEGSDRDAYMQKVKQEIITLVYALENNPNLYVHFGRPFGQELNRAIPRSVYLGNMLLRPKETLYLQGRR